MTLQQRYDSVLSHFEQAMPVAKTELHFHNDCQLLVAVVLSAQCTDRRVNIITPPLFEAYPTPQVMATATEDDVLAYIHSVSYPNSKARHLVALSRMICDEYGGEVPTTLDELIRLPGVGRKTANVVLGVAFGEARMAVDTHVFRVSHRLGLVPTSAKTPLAVEKALMQHIPEALVPRAHHWLILHGRYVCTALKPHCMSAHSPACARTIIKSLNSKHTTRNFLARFAQNH